MEDGASAGETYASPDVRDRFLEALDASDNASVVRLALDLTSCANPLPGMTREMLGLPPGSTYGTAARHLLALHAGKG